MKDFQRYAKWILALAVTIVVALLILGMLLVVPRINSKTGAHHAAVRIYEGQLHDVAPEAQFESHTCGLHTIRVIYKAYGLDPDLENLRFRLGVDVPASPIEPDSTGTLQPDLLRVLVQDGFDYELLPLNDLSVATTSLLDHLKAGNMAALLISRRENGNMHWVAAQKITGEKIVILDSLFPDVYREEPLSLVRECVLSCILVEPNGIGNNDSKAHLRDGIHALKNTVQRYRVVRKVRAELQGATNTALPRR